MNKTRAARAADLLALGELTDQEIADEVGVSRVALWKWKRLPRFAARVERLREKVLASLSRRAISRIEYRVDRLNRAWFKLKRVIDERAADPSMADVPGGTTGLLVRTVKGVGKGDDFRLVEVYSVDTGLLKELREIEKQAAIECGQWASKADVTVVEHPPRIAIPDADERPEPDTAAT